MSNKNKVKLLLVKPILTKEEIKEKEGDYFDEHHYTKHNKVITNDTDVYGLEEDGTKKLLLKFRKNVIPQSVCSDAYTALEKHARHKNSNRGAAAGKLSLSKLPNHVGEIIKQDKYRVFYKTKNGTVSRDNVSNIAQSNIAGYYDRPDRNNYNKVNEKNKTQKKEIPMCRTTQFTKKNVEKWKKSIPLIEHADRLFKHLIPDRHKIQFERATKTPEFQINNTAYSTITINYNWRTAAHCDSGDLDEGFGNLIILEKAKSKINTDSGSGSGSGSGSDSGSSFKGGFLGFPRWGVCVDCRQGDFLAMDVHEYHSNTPIDGDGRLSVVCYLRKKMIQCMKI
jgi:hypothetical protein